MGGKLVVIVGGQYGSEAKGAIAAHLARTTSRRLMAVRVAGPNAGHTVYDDNDVEHKLRCIPVAAAVRPDAELRLAAGSEVDPDVLVAEIVSLERAGHDLVSRLQIDSQATRMTKQNQQDEQDAEIQARIGSTSKGIGAAREARIRREAPLWYEEGDQYHDVATDIRKWLGSGGEVHIEGTQGYGLGLHAGHYPYCTSSDCRAIDFLAMAGISPWDDYVHEFEVWIVARTFPIRVAGNSGPLYGERSWSDMKLITGNPDLVPERTTVTNKIRRIGEFDPELVRAAIHANGGPISHWGRVRLALTFLDYVSPESAGLDEWEQLPEAARNYVDALARQVGLMPTLIGTGPCSIVDRRNRATDPNQLKMEA